MGGRGSGELLGRLAPPLGLADPVAAGALEALRATGPRIAARRAVIATERRRALDAVADLPVDAGPSQANLIWLHAPGLTGNELAGRLSRRGVIVAPGSAVGADDHVRATIQSPGATGRLLDALARGLAEPGQSPAD
jgi:histidinol-phosphate aminotransferase